MPADLLRSGAHTGLAVAAWAVYETLMPAGIDGGRAPAYARRRWVAAALGTTETALDNARRELLADVEGGPWLARSAPRGAKRAVKHAALRLPRLTREAYAAVPAWTLDLVHAGRRRPAGTITPDAWRLYALVLLARQEHRPLEASVGYLGALLGASAATGRRRLAELERVGLVDVVARCGGRLLVTPVLDAETAEQTALDYAERGRKTTAHPSQPVALTPDKLRHSPLPGSGTPQKTPVLNSDDLEAPDLPPAVGDVQVGRAAARPADAGEARRSPKKGRPTPKRPRRGGRGVVHPAAAELYRVLPEKLRSRIPEHGRRRVLAALTAELAARTPAELAERIAGRWQHWRYRPEEIADPTAVAITTVRRGYDCPRPECEDHRLPDGHECSACAEIGRQINEGRRAVLSGPQTVEHPAAGIDGPPPAAPGLSGALSASSPPCPQHPGAARRPGGECAGCWVDRIA
ncbi:hypothetical protein [Planomonospora alba]